MIDTNENQAIIKNPVGNKNIPVVAIMLFSIHKMEDNFMEL